MFREDAPILLRGKGVQSAWCERRDVWDGQFRKKSFAHKSLFEQVSAIPLDLQGAGTPQQLPKPST